MTRCDIHRLLVMAEGKLCGVLSSMDLGASCRGRQGQAW
jgi:hypothetical protein